MSNGTVKLYCEKCKKVRDFDITTEIDACSSHDLNHGTIDYDCFDPNVDINCDITVNYKMDIKCSYCNHAIYEEEGTKNFQY